MFNTMGYIKEPEGVDFYVDSTPLTEKDRNEISEIIAYYKLTGRKRKTTASTAHKTTIIRKQKAHQLV
jgi:hypothetical protein